MGVKFDYILRKLRQDDTYDDTVINAALAQEILDRGSADTTLQNNINAEATARALADTNEATARANADTTLQNNITAEATARANADSAEATARANADTALGNRISTLEANEYKVTYWASISSNSGTITKPTGSTIIVDGFSSGIDALVETIVNGQPSGFSPVTAGGAYVTVSSFDANGNYTLSGTPSATPVALLYILTIPADQYQNLDLTKVITAEPSNPIVQTITNGDTTHTPSSDAVYDALALKENTANKDASGGYVGLTLFKINFKNVANTFTSFFTNTNTASRTYTFPDKDGTVAMLSDTDGTPQYASASGTNTYTVSMPTTLGAYITGSRITINFANLNTGASTINVDTLGAKNIVTSDGLALTGGELQGIVTLVYNGTNYQIMGSTATSNAASDLFNYYNFM